MLLKGCCVGDIFEIIQERRLEAGKPPVPDFLLRNSEDEVRLISVYLKSDLVGLFGSLF